MMEKGRYIQMDGSRLPAISAADIASIEPPYVHFQRTYHEYIFYYILSGEMFLMEEEKAYHLTKDDFLILEPSKMHKGIKASACRFLYVHYSVGGEKAVMLSSEEWKKRSENENALLLPKYYHMRRRQHTKAAGQLAGHIREEMSGYGMQRKKQAACLFLELLLMGTEDLEEYLHGSMASVGGKAAQIMPELAEYLNRSYAENISGDLLQERYHYHFDYLNRQFKRWMGETIFVYLNRVRIERAKQLLSTGFYTMEETALETGFGDVYYFSRVFKKYTGQTPGQYMRATSC